MVNALTESMPTNHLGLFDEEGNVKVEETQKFMEISLKQLAEIFGLADLRLDRIGPKTKEKITELAGALEFVADSFDGNTHKAKFWLKTPNQNFGGGTPRELILRGRYKKVIQFIHAAKVG